LLSEKSLGTSTGVDVLCKGGGRSTAFSSKLKIPLDMGVVFGKRGGTRKGLL